MSYEFGRLGEEMDCPVSDGVIRVQPRDMLFLCRKHKIQYFAPLDTVTLMYDNHKEVRCECDNWAWHWRLLFWLRLMWNRYGMV